MSLQSDSGGDPPLPFLKWAGGKRWLTRRYSHLLPSNVSRYFEPFLGSGSVFWSLRPIEARLSDTNGELIGTYISIRDAWGDVYTALREHATRHSDEYFYKVRADIPTDGIKQAARFLYLNRTCWNGLYRVNKNGIFNVPRGTKDEVLLSTDNFELTSTHLRGVHLACCDFEETLDLAHEGDFAFVDPPYTTAHNLNGFIKYNDRIFSWADQTRLRAAVGRAQARGARILVTNADHESVRRLYSDIGQKITLNRPSVLAGGLKGRKQTTELAIILGYKVGVFDDVEFKRANPL